MSLWLVSKEKFHSSLTTQKNQPTKWGTCVYVLADFATSYVCTFIPYHGKITRETLIKPDLLLYPELFFNFSIISDRHGLTSAVTTFLLTGFIQAQHLPVN
jgi:hypothetical protein